MSVSYTTIIQKMLTELNQAQANKENKQAVHKHITHVKLLSEIILAESTSGDDAKDGEMTAEEMKAMLGESKPKTIKHQKASQQGISIDHDEQINDDSIFDF